MPIQLPDLDNKTFDDFMKEMIASIPKYSKKWSNFNPSDPGITLVEMLAWIAESLLYRANRIPSESYLNFLKLVAGPGDLYDETDTAHKKLLDYVKEVVSGTVASDLTAMKAAVREFLDSRYTAVTVEDFKALALEASGEVKRVEVILLPNYLEIVLVMRSDVQTLIDGEIEKVRKYLEPRLLLGTMIYVKNAAYTDVELSISITCENYVSSEFTAKLYTPDVISKLKVPAKTLDDTVACAIFGYLDRINGGSGKTGWPYGRDLIIYELYHIIEKIGGVVNVNNIGITYPAGTPFPLKVDGLIRLRRIVLTTTPKDL